MPVDKWDGKTIEIQRLSDANPEFLDAYDTVPRSRFKLKRNDQIPGGGTSKYPRYELSFSDRDMIGFWTGVWLLEVGGDCPPPSVTDLPEWKADDEHCNEAWGKQLDPISAAMREDNPPYKYLQGYLPVIITDEGQPQGGYPQVDRVRMLYLDQAINKTDDGKDDLVLVVLKLADGSWVRAQEDGAGGGPPR